MKKDKNNDAHRSMKEDLKVALYFLKLTFRISKSYIPLMIISAIFQSASPFLAIIIPKYIIDELMGSQRISKFVLYVAILIIGNGILNLINKFLTTQVQLANNKLIIGFELHMGKHIMNMDFENLEDPNILDMKEKAIFPINNQGVLWRMVDNLIAMVRITFTLIGLGAIIAILNPLIVVLIIAIVAVNGVISKKAQKVEFELYKELIPLNRRFGYYSDLMTDFSIAKDVRIYNMAPYIGKKISKYCDDSYKFLSKSMISSGKYMGINSITLSLEMLFIYAYMVIKLLSKSISVGDFSMYISAGMNFTTSITEFITNFVTFRQMCQYLETYLEFEQLPNKRSNGTGHVDNVGEATIEFRHVYFKYPRSDEYTLKDVNIIIKNGQKLSVVGQNGAGKTTFIKLLCRLYTPEKGEILLNGININEYSFDEYIKLLAVVFQDFKLFSFSLKENIVFNKAEDISDEFVMDAIDKVGLTERVNELEKGLDTSIYKNFDKNGVELSGGQAQKLAIARAVYKDAPIVVLDEPTAALDPYAEYEIYTSFNKLIGNHTAIYISHRLSSCKFCDKIALFDRGELVEYGTHGELVNNDGLYAKMWNAQAEYYA
jgi:ATP-binding cassette subfamily B protein/ATP-binding cassette subfamily C protein